MRVAEVHIEPGADTATVDLTFEEDGAVIEIANVPVCWHQEPRSAEAVRFVDDDPPVMVPGAGLIGRAARRLGF